jgi:large repetitive protein
MHRIAPRTLGVPAALTLLAGLLIGLGAMATPAAAATTIGQTGADAAVGCPGGNTSNVQVSTGSGVPSYVVPSGINEITSWSAQGGIVNSILALEIWRPTTTPGSYVLVGVSPPEVIIANTLNTFTSAPAIPVQSGDVLGQLSSFVSQYCFVTGSGPVGDVVGSAATSGTTLPTPGTTVAFTDLTFSAELNIAVTGISTSMPTTTSVASSQNPSAFGTPVDFTATVSADVPGAETPTGTVQFAVDGQNLGAPVALNGGSAISPPIATSFPGVHTVTATYSGAGAFQGGTGTLQQTVNGCAPRQTGHDLTAKTNVGTLFGLFCVNTWTGFGTYTQAPRSGEASVGGLGDVLRFLGANEIGAFGNNLFLLGANSDSHNTFVEFAPAKALGSFTLS